MVCVGFEGNAAGGIGEEVWYPGSLGKDVGFGSLPRVIGTKPSMEMTLVSTGTRSSVTCPPLPSLTTTCTTEAMTVCAGD